MTNRQAALLHALLDAQESIGVALTLAHKPRHQPVATITLRISGPQQERDGMTILKDTQKALYTVELRDSKGALVAGDGVEAPTWATSNPCVHIETPWGGDPLKAYVVADGIGTTQISFSCDADIGEGVSPLAITDDVQVLPGPAVSAGFVVGAVEEQ